MLNKTKVNEDEKIIKDICKKLDKLVDSIVHIDPNFVYIGSKVKGYYSIYNKNNYGKNIHLNLNFRLYYPDKKSFHYDKEDQKFLAASFLGVSKINSTPSIFINKLIKLRIILLPIPFPVGFTENHSIFA